jgi:hypothetical protein
MFVWFSDLITNIPYYLYNNFLTIAFCSNETLIMNVISLKQFALDSCKMFYDLNM